MDPARLLPTLLGVAWLLPLASFTVIVFAGRRLGKEGYLASYVATGAILGGFVLSLASLGIWVSNHPLAAAHHEAVEEEEGHASHSASPVRWASFAEQAAPEQHAADGHAAEAHTAGAHHPASEPPYYAGIWYSLGQFGRMSIDVGYHIDALTVLMFTMVTLIASCIHFYAIGYMHDELHEIVDHEVTLPDGHHLHRPGRFHRFFQYLSLFCFSMLGLVIAGNVAMVFVFWELVGICSYFLIGFYFERKSASNAANKAFIVNRVGDFGMIIGLMALWGSLGTFNFGDVETRNGLQPGIFSQVRSPANHFELRVPDRMVQAAAVDEIAAGARPDATQLDAWRASGWGYWLLVVAGLGIFCGCVGKSAQFPLHVWLPDAMEGPTPVSALVHSATMVAAGVYLVGRFYPVFAPEVLLVIAYVGGITLFLAASIAITATDIKRVLAYSTVSQLGYMMLALGVGGWLAGVYHLFTHAFFKSLLFMCSGSVIHAAHTNDMTRMGGLRRKMPWTAYTMLAGCLAIIGAGIPFVIGASGYYSKDSIIAQALSFRNNNPLHGWLFYAAAGGAAITAFYMFRLWYLTFAGTPRDHHVYDHAHESPRIMYLPLVILAFFSITVAWGIPGTNLNLEDMLESARRPTPHVRLPGAPEWSNRLVIPDEHLSHEPEIHEAATWIASATAFSGFLMATVFYGWRLLSADEVRRQFAPVYKFLVNKWYFDELYNVLFVQPVFVIAGWASWFDRNVLDRLIDALARGTVFLAKLDDLFDRAVVDHFVNLLANVTYTTGLGLRRVQSGQLRTYVMSIVLGTVVLFVVISFALNYALAR